jgi:hypothetical protein
MICVKLTVARDIERLHDEHRRLQYHLSVDSLRLKPDFENKLRVSYTHLQQNIVLL